MSDKSQFTAGVAQIVHDTKLFDEDGQLSKDYCLNVVVSTKDLVNRLRDSFETDPRLEQIADGIVEAMMEDEDVLLELIPAIQLVRSPGSHTANPVQYGQR